MPAIRVGGAAGPSQKMSSTRVEGANEPTVNTEIIEP